MKLSTKRSASSKNTNRQKSRKTGKSRLGILTTKMWPIFIYHGFKRFSKKELYGVYTFKWGYPYTDSAAQTLCDRMVQLGGLSLGVRYFIQDYEEPGVNLAEEVFSADPVSLEID